MSLFLDTLNSRVPDAVEDKEALLEGPTSTDEATDTQLAAAVSANDELSADILLDDLDLSLELEIELEPVVTSTFSNKQLDGDAVNDAHFNDEPYINQSFANEPSQQIVPKQQQDTAAFTQTETDEADINQERITQNKEALSEEVLGENAQDKIAQQPSSERFQDATDAPSEESEALQADIKIDNIEDFILEKELAPAAPSLIDDYIARQKINRKRIILAASGIGALILAYLLSIVFIPYISNSFFSQNSPANDIALMPPEDFALAESQGPNDTTALEPIDFNSLPKRRFHRATPTKAAGITEPKQASRIKVNTTTVNPEPLREAYASLANGNLETAFAQYTELVNKQQTQAAALSGLASIEIKRKNYQAASGYLLKVIRLDPSNTFAISSLATLAHRAASHNRTTSEDRAESYNSAASDSNSNSDLQVMSQLKLLHEQHPNNASISYLLGNYYAARSQWPDAQKYYFAAHSSAPRNPDYAYNLAIALDHLNKNDRAVTFYRTALTLSKERSFEFSTETVQKRLKREPQ